MPLVTVTESYLEDIADAIRGKNGASASYTPAQMASAITAIPTGGIDPSDATATAADILMGTTAYISTGKVNGEMPMPNLPTSAAAAGVGTQKAEISRSTFVQYINISKGYVSASGCYKINSTPNGAVTAPATITGTGATVTTGTNALTLSKTISVTPSVTTAGYISAGTAGNSNVSLTATVTTKGSTTYYATASQQTAVASGIYTTGSQTIAAVTTSNLAAGNIRSGVVVKVGDSADDDRIATVTGTFTNDATASASDIVSGKMAYASGASVSGSLVIQHYYTGTTTPASNLGVNGDIYLKTS